MCTAATYKTKDFYMGDVYKRQPWAGAVKATAFWRTPVKCVAFHDIPLHTEKPVSYTHLLYRDDETGTALSG